jgi:outer membrane protein OmpA-like peptidoglycan-associated protein
VTTTPTPPVTPPVSSVSIPTPREVTYVGDSTALSARAKNVLAALVKRLSAGGSLTIIGYAQGDRALALSRAEVVAIYLRQHLSLHVSLKTVTSSSVPKVMIVTTKL